jgi:hypothetical protein
MGAGAGDGRGEGFAVFFGELKKLNLDFVGGGVTSLGGVQVVGRVGSRPSSGPQYVDPV